jgi:omega-hydroxy-beta-dihydromenaquinone-9 sulfotransferase
MAGVAVSRGERVRAGLCVSPGGGQLSTSSAERLRIFLVSWFLTSLCGMTLSEYMRLLRSHRFAVAPAYWPRATFMGGMGALNSIFYGYEKRVYGPEVASAHIKPPLFILGHWRSGTTYLHNLLATDMQFAYPNIYQVLNPHTFLTTERYSKFLFMSPKTRIMDNVRLDAGVPFEDEFAICGTLRSPFLTWVFPEDGERYDRYFTFRHVPERETAEWAAALTLFYKKLAWKYNRPLLLKSPPHTSRIKLLLSMFPDARFIHIHRDPYTVFQSSHRQTEVSLRTMGLQHLDVKHIDALVIRRYKIIYDAFFRERGLISADRFHEVSFEELEREPVGQVERLYDQLSLPGFDVMRPALERYVASNSDYRKNVYPDLSPPRRGEISRAWHRSFEQWGYAK